MAVLEFLSLCPNLEDIALWMPFPFSQTDIPALTSLRLTRLSFDVVTLLEQCGVAVPNLAFPFVTHLDISTILPVDGGLQWAKAISAHFPALTHLSLMEMDDHHFCKTLLGALRKLRVLISVIGSSHYYSTSRPGKNQSLATFVDQRIVKVLCCPSFVEDWEAGARGGVDMYKVAEDVIAERRRIASGESKEQ